MMKKVKSDDFGSLKTYLKARMPVLILLSFVLICTHLLTNFLEPQFPEIKRSLLMGFLSVSVTVCFCLCTSDKNK